LVDWGERPGWDSGSPGRANGAIVPLDPKTGEEVRGWEPLRAGQALIARVSPDGRHVAFSWALTQSGPWRLTIVAVDTGETVAEFDLPQGVYGAHWSTDGSSLLAVQDNVDVDESAGSRLWEFRWETPAAVRPLGDLPYQLAALREGPGHRFYALGFVSDECCGIEIKGDPFLVALEWGDEVARVPLPGVVLGQRFEQRGASDSQANIIRQPGIAISPAGDRLYIAHADDDAITVVDLETMAVDAVVTPTAPKSALGRFGSWLGSLLVSEARAKGGAYYTKEAVVSPDGRYLYVTGYEPEFCEADESFPCIERKPIGLQIVDLASMEVVARHEGIARITFTPGWDRMVGTGETIDYRDSDAPRIERHGPYVIDTASHNIIGAPAADQPDLVRGLVGWEFAPSTDGLHGFIAVGGPGMEEAVAEGRNCATNCYALRTYDLETGDVVSERYYDGYVTFINLVPQP
jgi:hypothetical protein